MQDCSNPSNALEMLQSGTKSTIQYLRLRELFRNHRSNSLIIKRSIPESKVHGANMRSWVLSAPDGPQAGPMNLAIRDILDSGHAADTNIFYSGMDKDMSIGW